MILDMRHDEAVGCTFIEKMDSSLVPLCHTVSNNMDNRFHQSCACMLDIVGFD
jgi:hypothetical protein